MLTSSIGRHSSGFASMPLRMKMAALFTRMWTAPNAATASAAIRVTLGSSETSVCTKSARPPAFLICSWASRPVASSRSAITTAAPSSANNSAVARPIPAPAPVMTATFPFKRFMAGSSSVTMVILLGRRVIAAFAQEQNQVSHFLEVDILLEPLGHQGFSRGAKFINFRAQQVVFNSVGAAKLERGGGFFGEEAGEDLAIAGRDRERDVVWCHFVIGIDDVAEQRVGALPAIPERSGPTRWPWPWRWWHVRQFLANTLAPRPTSPVSFRAA